MALVFVSTHAPARGATSEPRVLTACKSVSTHAPARGATHVRCHHPRDLRFQLTRPRGARHAKHLAKSGDFSVSTHAPARGATPSPSTTSSTRPVSTHAPARGATRCRRHRRRVAGRFNSRAREGRDSPLATRFRVDGFQLTRPRGARPLFPVSIQHGEGFQLTRPRGARPEAGMTRRAAPPAFQLTRPRGARHPLEGRYIMPGGFQLTRPRGARLCGEWRPMPHRTFQLTRPRGARLLEHVTISQGESFNSRAREGRDGPR